MMDGEVPALFNFNKNNNISKKFHLISFDQITLLVNIKNFTLSKYKILVLLEHYAILIYKNLFLREYLIFIKKINFFCLKMLLGLGIPKSGKHLEMIS